MESRIISERAFKFSCRTVKLCERLWTKGPAARRIVTTADEVAWELDEAQQLKAMITAAIKAGQNSTWRGGS